ncbi:hypothetical protein JCM10212_000275 [Sporobolomyces blumeae]
MEESSPGPTSRIGGLDFAIAVNAPFPTSRRAHLVRPCGYLFLFQDDSPSNLLAVETEYYRTRPIVAPPRVRFPTPPRHNSSDAVPKRSLVDLVPSPLSSTYTSPRREVVSFESTISFISCRECDVVLYDQWISIVPDNAADGQAQLDNVTRALAQLEGA